MGWRAEASIPILIYKEYWALRGSPLAGDRSSLYYYMELSLMWGKLVKKCCSDAPRIDARVGVNLLIY